MEIQNDNKKGGPKLSAQVEICDRGPKKRVAERLSIYHFRKVISIESFAITTAIE